MSKRTKIFMSVIVLLLIIGGAGFYINLKVYDFYTPVSKWFQTAIFPRIVAKTIESGDSAKTGDAEKPREDSEAQKVSESKESAKQDNSAESADPNKPAVADKESKTPDANQPAEPNKPADPNEPVKKPAEPNEPPGDPNNPMEKLNLKEVEMKDIIAKLAEWTDKVIITSDEVMKQKITIYSAKKLPRSEALSIIYAALRAKGFVAEETSPNMITLKPIKEAILGAVPTIPAGRPLASIANKNQIVQYFFHLDNYSATKMSNIILAMIGEHGYVSADEDAGTLLIIDTVENLIRFERVIAQFDVPEAEPLAEEVFPIRFGDPAEIVQILQMLLSNEGGGRGGSRGRGRGDSSGRGGGGDRGSSGRGGGDGGGSSGRGGGDSSGRGGGGGGGGTSSPSTSSGSARSVVLGSADTPIILIPEPKRKWIIARASPEDIKQIGEWIKKLDTKEPVTSEYETIKIDYADVREVASRLNEALQNMPGTELRTSVLIQPLEQARQIVVYGRTDIREMVKKLIIEIDVPSGDFETKVFTLKHADADQIKENLEGLYEQTSGSQSSYRFGRYSSRRIDPKDTVRIVAFPTMQQVTVIASPENIIKIEAQIKEWDVPLDVEKVKPRIIELNNSDPIRMAELLTRLFSEETGGRPSIWDYYFGRDDDRKKIVGPLYGQLTFEAVPDTKKIIVISKIPEAYTVIEELIKELDSREKADVPKVITLKYADAEDLCEQLNAILNEPGTRATLRRSSRGLSKQTVDSSGQTQSEAGQDDTESREDITPWWSSGGGSRQRGEEEMPISNIIGRIRFIPVHRSKAILVLAPPEYIADISKMIEELDQPGKQVMVKAVIVQVDHSSMTSLGIKLGSDVGLGALGDNAIAVLTKLSLLETHGSVKLEASMGVNAVIDFLDKQANARVLNQPTLWTKDNEEAEFFKGKRVPFITGSRESSEGGSRDNDYSYEPVGVTLRVRPNITPEKDVDMVINLIISQLEQETIAGQPVPNELKTTTHLIVKDGETVMLGGILFQNTSEIEQKVPLLGDIPLVGNIFRHNDSVETNNELLVFITPYVIDDHSSMPTMEELEKADQKLKSILKEMEAEMSEGQ